ncbi:F0F1 ATP synthase subunit gamma [Magnetovibrio blakemorei]|uniref:ATP synthase gamma chain n=1 Tax=Magnetovibrio blakemorei TaxID=28181 RepID=A0A1E5QAU3_9PROT|nr:F0F1 ATP synthase subunit gamma [Magnetovibrio blakemorei]OEJ69150.1 F0F1 ATP synthase subunit gamma [Magnetovibrio blakemorei]
MANLKDLKIRIDSVKSTRKITSAMKMVAAAKLRRAQDAAESARAYSQRMDTVLRSLAGSFAGVEGGPELLAGNGQDQTHLLVVFTSDRGLCGGFNGTIVRETRRLIHELRGKGKTVKLLCVGRKGGDLLKSEFRSDIVDRITGIGGKKGIEYTEATAVSDRITAMFEAGEFDVCTIVFNKFQSAMTQIVTSQQLIPFAPEDAGLGADVGGHELKAVYEFEPEESEILEVLLPKNLGVQLFQAMLESSASEHGSRMTAMDNATRNAGEMIDRLTLKYNRTRQANITSELIEIISGAEAL